jgi:hypothetical protein
LKINKRIGTANAIATPAGGKNHVNPLGSAGIFGHTHNRELGRMQLISGPVLVLARPFFPPGERA